MTAMDEIVRYAIHPGIVIARVGNSPEEYFIGPEAPGVGFKARAGEGLGDFRRTKGVPR